MLRLIALLLAVFALAPAAHAEEEEDKIDCSNAMSTVEMNHCAGLELEKADAELNKVYKMALARIPEMAGEPPFDAKSWEGVLRASQRAWVTFRDAECDGHAPMSWGGGTGTTVAVLGCKTSLTEARTKMLKDQYEQLP